jgi:hypothetical protein
MSKRALARVKKTTAFAEAEAVEQQIEQNVAPPRWAFRRDGGRDEKVDYFGASAGAAGSFFIAMWWWWCTT